MQMEIGLDKQEIPDELFQKMKKVAEEKYNSHPEVFCPYLNSKVHLNIKGWEHIAFKKWNKVRVRWDQYIRFKLLHLVPVILSKSHTVQGKWNTFDWERQKKHGKWEKVMKNVIYYEFVAVIGKVRIKVIVKEIENNDRFFLSIIPFWKMNLVTKEKIVHEGNLDID